MSEAIKEASAASARGEVPVGAVIIENGKILARAGNEIETLQDPTAHAEMLAIRRACEVKGTARLVDCDIYVTLEPCAMCAAAISAARLRRVYFGAYDPKSGGVEHGARVFSHTTCHHKPDVYGGIAESECSKILTDFFKGLRNDG